MRQYLRPYLSSCLRNNCESYSIIVKTHPGYFTKWWQWCCEFYSFVSYYDFLKRIQEIPLTAERLNILNRSLEPHSEYLKLAVAFNIFGSLELAASIRKGRIRNVLTNHFNYVPRLRGCFLLFLLHVSHRSKGSQNVLKSSSVYFVKLRATRPQPDHSWNQTWLSSNGRLSKQSMLTSISQDVRYLTKFSDAIFPSPLHRLDRWQGKSRGRPQL